MLYCYALLKLALPVLTFLTKTRSCCTAISHCAKETGNFKNKLEEEKAKKKEMEKHKKKIQAQMKSIQDKLLEGGDVLSKASSGGTSGQRAPTHIVR